MHMRLVIALGALVSFSSAQDVFRSPATLLEVNVPQTVAGGTVFPQVAAADFDGDGIGDLAMSIKAAAVPSEYIVVLALGTSDGGFTSGPSLFVGDVIRELQVGDLNADGVPDLAAATSGASTEIHLYLGAGDGTFVSPVVLPAGGLVNDLKIVDVDGDTHLDLIALSFSTQRIAVMLGDGNGGLAPAIFSLSPAPVGAFDIGDLDGDGILDLVLDGWPLQTMVGQGDGSFVPGVSVAVPISPVTQVALFDANGDNVLDIAVPAFDPFSPSLVLLVGDGRGDFSFVSETPTSLFEKFEAVDIDEDGDLDLLGLVSGFRGEVAVVQNDQNGIFEEKVFGFMRVGEDFDVHDMNGNGDLDVVSFDIAQPFSSSMDDAAVAITVLRGNGTGGFVGASSGRDDSTEIVDFAAADFDGDGDVDVLALDVHDGRMVMMEQLEFGAFSSERSFLAGGLSDVSQAGDLDGDGDLDVVFAADAGARVLRNDGGLTFTSLPAITGSEEAEGVELIDADNDGDLDLLVAAEDDQEMLVFLNAGNATFGSAITHATAGRPVAFAVGDHNADGLDDVVVGQSFTNANDMYLSNGDGSFTRFTDVTPIFGHSSVASGDVNADGLRDIVLGTGPQGIRLSLATSATTFAPAVILADTVPGTEGDMQLADVDRDGLLDVVFVRDNIAPFGTSELVVLRGLGNGTFAPEEVSDLPEGTGTMILADVTNDGTPEAIVGGEHWMVTVVANTRGAWQDLGQPLAGTAGLPRLFGEGQLVAGTPFELSLRDAAPSSPVTLLIGFETLFAPLKGGVLVPDPVKFIFGLSTDTAGDLALGANWPTGLEGIDVVLQWWLADPAGAKGFAASNALSGETRLP